MRTSSTLLAVALALAGLGAAEAQSMAKAAFIDASGKSLGGATLTQTPNGLLLELDLSGLPPGAHGFHIHKVGRCDVPGFQSAGDHFAPQQRQHGVHVTGGPHGGDMPNQFVAADGRLRANVLNVSVTLTAGPVSVFDGDGSALVLHAKADDYRSQPSGDSGERIACAVIEPAAAASAGAASRP